MVLNDAIRTLKNINQTEYINFEIINDSLGSIIPPGTYEALPYIIIESNDNVPAHLLNALESGYNEFSEKYFKYPIYRTGGKFTITE